MVKIENKFATGKWHERYLPFVAKSPEMQVEWLTNRLSRLRDTGVEGKTGILSREELNPYIKLLLQDGVGTTESAQKDSKLSELLAEIEEDELLLLIECADIYDIPRLFKLLSDVNPKQAIMALKKEPPPFEKKPLMVIDRVFHSIKEKSTELLEVSARGVLESDNAPVHFAANYERYKEIMMDEHILSLLYPKAR